MSRRIAGLPRGARSRPTDRGQCPSAAWSSDALDVTCVAAPTPTAWRGRAEESPPPPPPPHTWMVRPSEPGPPARGSTAGTRPRPTPRGHRPERRPLRPRPRPGRAPPADGPPPTPAMSPPRVDAHGLEHEGPQPHQLRSIAGPRPPCRSQLDLVLIHGISRSIDRPARKPGEPASERARRWTRPPRRGSADDQRRRCSSRRRRRAPCPDPSSGRGRRLLPSAGSAACDG